MKEIDWSKAPEGTTHLRKDDFRFPWRKFEGNIWHTWHDGVWIVVTNSDQSHYVAKPNVGWTGEGLPPVGVRCEYFDGGEWMPCEVVAHRNNAAVVLSDCYEADFVPRQELRPIRTPEQIEAEERGKAIEALAAELAGHWSTEAVSLQRETAAYLHDIGYRKVSP